MKYPIGHLDLGKQGWQQMKQTQTPQQISGPASLTTTCMR